MRAQRQAGAVTAGLQSRGRILEFSLRALMQTRLGSDIITVTLKISKRDVTLARVRGKGREAARQGERAGRRVPGQV